MQWVPLIQKIRHAGKSVVVDMCVNELNDFIDAVGPEGIYLCIGADQNVRERVIERVKKW